MPQNVKRILPFLPFTATVLAVALVVGLTWILPATKAGTVERQTSGDRKTVTWDGQESRTTQFEWTDTITLPSPPSEVQVYPRLALTIKVPATPNSGRSEFQVDVRVFLNGVEAGREVGGHVSDVGDTGGLVLEGRQGIPQRIEQIRQNSLQAGENHVRIQAELRLKVETSGSQRILVSIGPMETLVFQSDGDGDGVVDAHQLVRQAHTAWVAVPLAFAGGGAAWWGTKRLLRPKAGQP